MPQKIRQLIAALEAVGFHNRGGKGSHWNFEHPKLRKAVTISGKLGDDAQPYQERLVRDSIAEAKR